MAAGPRPFASGLCRGPQAIEGHRLGVYFQEVTRKPELRRLLVVIRITKVHFPGPRCLVQPGFVGNPGVAPPQAAVAQRKPSDQAEDLWVLGPEGRCIRVTTV